MTCLQRRMDPETLGSRLMAKKPKYVREYKDRHGVTRIEFRKRGHKGWPLRQPLRSPEFWEDYEAASSGGVPPGVLKTVNLSTVVRSPTDNKSFRWLITQYKASPKFKRLGPSTRRVRARILEKLCTRYGDYPYAELNSTAVMKLRDQRADAPEAANAIVKAIRQVYQYALEYQVAGVTADPTRDVKNLRPINPDGFHAWTTEEVEKFEYTHPIGTKARLALSLMLYAGCVRRSDVVLLGRQHLTKDGRLHYRQHKGRDKSPVEIDVPVIDELRKVLDASPLGDMTFLVTEFGRPFTPNGFGNWFKKRCVEAGIPHCSAHGVRKVAAAKLAELGCSDHEIMAIGGWKTLKEVQRYTKSARRQILADSGMQRLQKDLNETKVSNLDNGASLVRQKRDN